MKMKFLGQIRKKALNGNEVGRYLVYALGEIVLVVIGILFAVQIDDYYGDVKIRSKEIIFLRNLKTEMINNQNKLLEAISYQERSLNACDTLLKIYSGSYTSLSNNEIDSLFAEAQWAWIFNPEISSLKLIKTTDQFQTISNEKIKYFISSYEDMVIDAQEESLISQNIIINRYVPQVSKYISLTDRLYYMGYTKLSRSKFKSDYKGIFNDREIESTLAYIYGWHKIALDEEKVLLETTKEFISVIDLELKLDE